MTSFLKYTIENNINTGIPLEECIFRYGSIKYLEYFSEVREKYHNNELTEISEELQEILELDIGEYGFYESEEVPLDIIFEEDPELNKVHRGGSKKFYVFVRDPNTKNIKKISFGDTTGLSVKYNNPERKKAFAARHNCSSKTDKTTAGYWACRVNKYLGKTNAARAGYW